MGWINTIIAPAWNALTGAQQTAWGTFAAANPYINSRGEIISTSGYNLYTSVNTWLITTDEDDRLSDPPANLDIPPQTNLDVTFVRVKSLQADGTTRRHRRLLLELPSPVPTNTLLWFRCRGRSLFKAGRSYTVPHKLTYARPGESGIIDLGAFRGIPTPSARSLRRNRIIGINASMTLNSLIAQVITVNMLNGRIQLGTLNWS